MKKQLFSFNIRMIPLFVIICAGLMFFVIKVSAAEPNLFNIDKQNIRKLLTDEEKIWLSRHKTIRIAGPRAFPPFHYYQEDGTLKGMASDYIHLIFKYLDIQPQIRSNMEWINVLKEAEAQKIDLISCSAKTIDREKYLTFSAPYLSFPLVIVTKTDARFIGGLDDLHSKTVTFVKGNAAYDWIRRDNIRVLPNFVKTPLDGLKAVSLGQADATIENLATATYLIQKDGLANLKIAAPAFNENYNLFIAVRKDWPELVSIINKILAATTPQQHSAIRDRWLSVKNDYGLRRSDVIKWVLGTGCIIFFILAVFLIWNRRLSKEINERKLVEEALRKSEAKFRLAFHTSPDSINLTRVSDGMYIDINDGFTKILGYSRDDVIGKTSLSLNIWKNSEDRKRLVDGLSKTGYVENLIAPFVGKNGKICMGMMSASMIQISGEDVILSVTRDITGLLKAEEDKIRAQKIAADHEKLALVGQIAGKIAHDFNNVLGIIMGNTELALLDCMDAGIKNTLELIYRQTMRGKNLTKNLVAFAKDQEPRQEFFRIHEKIDLVINLLKKDLEGIELIRKDQSGVPDLLADPGMIEHALVNLIQNSIHALSMVDAPKMIIRTYSLDNYICFEIEDNGCGIPKENLENIYDPSFTLKGSKDLTGSYRPGIKGTGYGMSNVKKYIQQHKGRICVESELGSGTKFIINLPIMKKELTCEEKIKIRTGNACFEKHILLVEDEQAISDVQYRILTQEPCNHKVDIASNGKIAMDLFARNQYDLISLDYILSGKINGMDVYHHIREENKIVPILFVSGNIDFLEAIDNLKQKDPYLDNLSKPCKNIDYVNCINKLFRIRTI
ncbi:MAG: transporter substrate-binding domain-containing protein [Pseudomonadota bacterium]